MEGPRARLNEKFDCNSRMSTKFFRQNVTVEPFVRVSRISASSPKFLLWSIQRYYNYTRNFVVLQESFRKASRLTRRFILTAKAVGLLGEEDKMRRESRPLDVGYVTKAIFS